MVVYASCCFIFFLERGGGSAEPRTRLDFLLLLQIMAVCFSEQLSWKSAVLRAQGREVHLKWFLLSFLLLFLNTIEGDGSRVSLCFSCCLEGTFIKRMYVNETEKV